MFQSIERTTINNIPRHRVIDSEFDCHWVLGIATLDEIAKLVIDEYAKRELNVAKNFVLYLQWYEKTSQFSVAKHIGWFNREYPGVFTPELREELGKYLALL
jgi:hypothetical protein